MNLTAPQKNAVSGLDMLLRLSQVRVTRATLQEKLWQHPDFPTLTALSDTLDEFRVENMAAHLTADQLPEIPLPALAYLSSEGGFFAPVRATAANTVEWWHNKWGWQKDSTAQFSQKWNGVMLLIEPTERSGEAGYAQSRKKQLVKSLRIPFVVLSLLVCLGVWAGVSQLPVAGAPQYYVLLLLKLAGLLVSSLLVWYSLDADNVFLRSLCQLNSRTSCSSVLNTPAAQLFGWLSWAEVGLLYFSGGLLSLLLFRANPSALYPLLFVFSIASLPYTVWSVYYQWRRVRQWCVLCLAVQALLWLEFGVQFYFQRQISWPATFGPAETGLLVAGFLLPAAVWAFIKPTWAKALRVEGLQQSLQKIKFDQGYLESLGRRARTLPPIFTGMRVPTLGNADAPHTLIVVTNPTCALCARVHSEIEALMAELEDVCCQFIIAVEHRPGDAGDAVACRVLSRSHEEMPLALHQWYETPRLAEWLKKTPGPGEEDGTNQVELHQRWCELAGVDTTPTIFFNGVDMPRHFAVVEFRKLIKQLREQMETMG
ncbi:vitamin K epoxide reductase family protein [Hymenobacter sp. IS2118]|uniref:vitamin K epoxide reductase family protein n=1 Tax=Hymenobacter sp. IS2118 TaxID=1505605 RepID=UPI00054FD8DA|nr:vitamin K epoxide reductase family protein [Hymenobacter sp. IS2118]